VIEQYMSNIAVYYDYYGIKSSYSQSIGRYKSAMAVIEKQYYGYSVRVIMSFTYG